MSLIDKIYQENDSEKKIEIAEVYWNNKSKIEIAECLFMSSVRISSIISSDQNMRSALACIRRNNWPTEIDYFIRARTFIQQYKIEGVFKYDYLRLTDIHEYKKEFGY